MAAFSQSFWDSIGLLERGGHFSQPMSTTAKLKKSLTIKGKYLMRLDNDFWDPNTMDNRPGLAQLAR